MGDVKFTKLAPGESRAEQIFGRKFSLRREREPGEKRTQRHRTQQEKDALVREVLEGGHGTAALVAEREGLNINLLSRWKKDYVKR